MQHLPFRWIETFRIVASTGSMTGAAQVLSLDQSAMSRHISALEGHLNLTLFDRTKRRLRLTPEGQELLPEAEDAAGAVARFERKAEARLQTPRRIHEAPYPRADENCSFFV